MTLFLYSLNKRGKAVTFEERDEKIINGGTQEVFTNQRVDKALFKTLQGIKVFDSTNTEVVATHELRVVWRSDVGAEEWVKFGNVRLKILTAENCCVDDRVLILMCTERGEASKVVNQA